MNIQHSTSNIQHPIPDQERMPFGKAWIASVLLPLPTLLFWHSHDGRFVSLCLFFAGCAGFVACAFRADSGEAAMQRPPEVWRGRMSFLALALLAEWTIFSVCCLAVDAHDLIAPVLALGSLVPALAVTPFLTLTTRKPFAAVIFTMFLVGCMKLLGCSVVVLIHGWHADAQGYTTLTWLHPNLLVCLFLLNTALLSTLFYFLGRNKFTRAFGLEVHRRIVPTSLSHEN